ncbi:MAG: phenylalanine--tRNA ligase subunit beta [Kiritimatiellae bacterium]|nr:phenylalanine--tRNA ligase subunit beta [Kiritimatiellia bacterium]
MKLPVSWLAEYIDISDMSVEELADRITFAGIEIEGISRVGADYSGICAARVESCEPHPDSDHLHVCRVFDGKDTLQVVCGAPNCRAGLVTAFAHVGATVPENGAVLKKGKLRGVESFGMLCSGRELSLSSDHSGIMELPESVAPGTPVEGFAEVDPPETVFDVEITWNRGDCLSIIGIAREFSAILGRPLKLPPVDFPVLPDKTAADFCSVTVENAAACPAYTARVLPHVERLPSPKIMRRRLELCGMRSIDVVVDVSNYVMLECGQPLHTFDYRRVHDGKIVVRNAHEAEKIRTLDGQDRTLLPSMLLITDPEGPLAVAGVMGGEGSEIEPDTSSVLLESASFTAPGVKDTATALDLHTESSHRYERGVDPFLCDWASRRACHLLVKYANATVAEGCVVADSRDHAPRRIPLRFRRAVETIGMDIPPERQIAILESLAFKTVEKDATRAVFEVPSYRLDCTDECDLIEEIARMNGLAALPDVVPASQVVPGADDSPARAATECRHALAGLGFSEVMNYSFTAPAVLDLFFASQAEHRIRIPNPVSADHSMLRDSLVPQVFSTLAYNATHGVATAAVFEMGRVFTMGDGKPVEDDRVCAAVMGFAGRDGTDRMRKVEPRESLSWLKGALEALCEKMHAPALRLEARDMDGFEPGLAAVVFIAGRPAGVFGLVKAETCRKHRI